MADLRPNPSVLEISPYVGGRASVPGVAKVHKLSANETPLGPSPKAIAAFRSAAETLQDYPDGGSSVLREAIASVHGLDPNRILCGNGSDELLHLIAQAYCAPGDEAIFSAHAFLVYRIATLAAGGHPIVVPEPERVVEVDRLLEAVTPRTRIVFVANPNNPTGTYLPESELRRLHAGLPASVLLVIDAAYAEYVGRNDYEAGTALVAGAPNVIMTRTFSKVYGLAALRIGWLTAAPAIIEALNRVRGPFNVSTPAQLAGAAAMRDQAFVTEAVRFNSEWLGYLSREISALGLAVDPSVGNFLLIHFPDEDGRRAADADRFLSARGLILRATANYGLPNALRLSVGTAEANTLVVEALRDFLAPKR